jgi:signal transduction histidine kinase
MLSNRTINNKIIDLLIDVTDRELLQNQLVRLAKLESLGILGSGIAHNFNNVLTGVIGYITYAQKFLEKPHKAFESLELAVSASHRASELAKQLMAFARGGAPDKKPLALEKLVMESTLLAVIGTQTHHSLQVAPLLHLVNGDASQLHQAFSCIAINAVQSMPTGGRLIIKIENSRLETGNCLGLPRGDYVEISFEDKGCGIPEENRQNIFVPYFTTKSNVGSGLGLATTHTIISGHGGAITFRSIVGAGTTFTIYLPAFEVKEGQELE